MLAWIGKNYRTLLLAFLLAIAVWVSAVSASDPDEIRPFPTPVTIEIIGQETNMLITNDYTKQVEVVLQAPQSVWTQLTTSADTVHAIVDITSLSAGSHQVPIQFQVRVQPTRIISTSLENLELVLEPLMTLSMPVEIELLGSPSIGYETLDTKLNYEDVIVSGPESIVNQVVRIGSSLNIAGIKNDLESTVTLQAYTQSGQTVSGVNLSQTFVDVTIPVIQQGGYRDLAVKVVVSGKVAEGYRLTSLLVNPPVITVFSSNPSLVEALPGFVETTQLDLEGVSADFETHLNLLIPDEVTLLGDQNVEVQVGISPIEGSLIINDRPVSIVGLEAGYIATISPETVDLYLSGPLPVLETMITGEVLVSVDLTGLTAGTYQLTPSVTIVVVGVRVETILPGTVEVIITRGIPTQSP
ncbi:YbbR-like domain-containing protein [Chloroflexota bacterium]